MMTINQKRKPNSKILTSSSSSGFSVIFKPESSHSSMPSILGFSSLGTCRRLPEKAEPNLNAPKTKMSAMAPTHTPTTRTTAGLALDTAPSTFSPTTLTAASFKSLASSRWAWALWTEMVNHVRNGQIKIEINPYYSAPSKNQIFGNFFFLILNMFAIVSNLQKI